jgi:hypothetical protein
MSLSFLLLDAHDSVAHDAFWGIDDDLLARDFAQQRLAQR